MFDSPTKLALGLLTGIVFGFLLQKGRAAKYEIIVGQFRLRDWTVVKIMGTAVIVGSVGVAALVQAGVTTLSVKPMLFGGVLVGAALFGAGLAILGYCPGTSIAAAGEGRRDAMVGVLGMVGGALIYVGAYPMLQHVIKALGSAGKVTLPEITHTSPWPWIASLALTGALAVALAARRRRRSDRARGSDAAAQRDGLSHTHA